MPWFPDFVSAVELARRQTHDAGLADPVAQYLRALNEGTSHDLETAWPGAVVIYDPRAGEVRGHRRLHRFVSRNNAWLAEHRVRIDTVASIRVPGRAVVELLAHLQVDGTDVAWPVAVVAESVDELSVVFRTYCSQQPVDGMRHVRSPILAPGADQPAELVGRYHAALRAGDVDAIVSMFAPDGYYREAIGGHSRHCGTDELRSFFTTCFSAGGGIELAVCAVTDDGVSCAVEYNCERWGDQQLPPQAGIGIYQRGGDGLLAAVRNYDDVEAPVTQLETT
jgi:limonene-1,2-epoxide hydrolase